MRAFCSVRETHDLINQELDIGGDAEIFANLTNSLLLIETPLKQPSYAGGCPYYRLEGCDDGFDEFSCEPCIRDYFSHNPEIIRRK